jgi:hypothetical protein
MRVSAMPVLQQVSSQFARTARRKKSWPARWLTNACFVDAPWSDSKAV